MTFGERLKALRKEKRLKQEEIAVVFKVDRSTYSKWENDSSKPEFEMLINLANFFQVSSDYLLGRIDFRAWDEKYNKNGELAAEVQYIESLNPYKDLTKDEIKQMENFKNFLISQRNK